MESDMAHGLDIFCHTVLFSVQAMKFTTDV